MTAAATYVLRLTQGGVDITSRVDKIGAQVTALVNAARTASYSYDVIGDGAIDPGALIDAAVLIEANTGAGFVTIFSGSIKRQPVYDPRARIMSVTATDGWQEFLDEKTQAELEALIPNAKPYNDELDGPRESGMQQALALLSTTRENAWLDTAGVLQVTGWTAKIPGQEDRNVLADEVWDVVPELAQADELQNKIIVTYEHTFTRRMHWSVGFSWLFGNGGFLDPWPTWCDWYTSTDIYSGHDLPTQTQVQSAAEGTGWGVIGGISYEGHPETFGPGTSEPCGPNIGWLLSDYYRTEVTAASWTGGRNFSIEARETLTLIVQNSPSIARYGEKIGEMNFSGRTEYDPSAVDADESPLRPDGFTDYGTGGTQAYKDEIDAIVRAENIECALAKADQKMAETHKRNKLTGTVLLDLAAELGKTYTINDPNSTMTGLIDQIVHTIGINKAISRIKISDYETGGGTQDPLVAPAITTQDPAESAPPAVRVTNKIGGQPESDVYDPLWEEQSIFTGNVWPVCVPPDCADPITQFYPVRFRAVGPDISDAAREAEELAASYTFEIAMPLATLSLNG